MGGVAIRFVAVFCYVGCFGKERMGLRVIGVALDGISLVFEYVDCVNGLFYSTESWDRFRQIKPSFGPEQKEVLKLCTEMGLGSEKRGRTERMPPFGIGEE